MGIANNAPLVWESVAAVADIEPTASEVAARLLNPTPHVSKNTGDNEWYTPDAYLDAARAVFYRMALEGECILHGGCSDDECPPIVTDPASSEIANERVQAATYFTAEDDGLAQEWHGTVWMNPPYAQPLIGKFADKLLEQLDRGNVDAAIVLVNNGTETAWGQKLLSACAAVCLPASRIRFLRPDGNPGAPLQGQMVLWFKGERLHRQQLETHRECIAEYGCHCDSSDWFAEEFGQFGVVLRGG